MNELFTLRPVDMVGVEERCARISSRSLKGDAKKQGLRLILSMIDLTTLEGKDTVGKVEQMCKKAVMPHHLMPELPSVAAVCVYPALVSTAKKALGNSGVKVASVATGFPSGQTSLQLKLDETRRAVEDGADEVDMVISRGRYLQGDYQYVFDEIAGVKEACGEARLKVILETGELGNLEEVDRASRIAIAAGANFIKTSTGKIGKAATLPVTYVMLNTIREHYLKTGNKIGMKPAGGISNSKLALHYLVMVKEVLGTEWLNNDLFRFGASSLANDVLMQIVKQESGIYQSAEYFSKD